MSKSLLVAMKCQVLSDCSQGDRPMTASQQVETQALKAHLRYTHWCFLVSNQDDDTWRQSCIGQQPGAGVYINRSLAPTPGRSIVS